MWKLSPSELLQFKGAGGEQFAQFVDRLIRAEAAKGGLTQSAIRAQLRGNIKDGGVDTEVSQAIPGEQSGWFSVPTCWQFKSVDASGIDDKAVDSRPAAEKRKKKKAPNDLQREIRGPYVKKLIQQGYGYHFCLLGDLTPQKCSDWEAQLQVEARKINRAAPNPRVVHGTDLLNWAGRFPAVVASLRNLSDRIFCWEAWSQNCQAVTPSYVPNPEWEGIRQQIVLHTDFHTPCVGGDPCLAVGGAAGVGKTRLVFETLKHLPASPGLVVYAADEQEAKSVATSIANISDQTAILIVDECSSQTRYFLSENLRGHVSRIRVICLDNTSTKLATLTPQIWLSADSLKNTDAILEANFPDVPADRRHQYAGLSRGFVRLAADMCQHDGQLARGDLSRLLGSAEQYVRNRLRSEHMPLVSLIALVHKIGFRDDVREEVEALCKLANCCHQDFVDAIRIVKDSPGFVVQAGRYWYVTPEIVARVLFCEGWERWVKGDPETFLKGLAEHLQQQVVDRAGKLGGEEVRGVLASFFRRWFDQLTVGDLAEPRLASLAAAVVESRPEEYLLKLRSVIDSSEAGDLEALRGDWNGTVWGPRRTLVWLFERLVSFPEFFEDCEACLFRLALDETEPQIGNNSTVIWRNLFSVHLSGTATPFQRRLDVLKAQMWSEDSEEVRLAFRGLSGVFDGPSGHVIGPPEVAGRLRPPDWQPASAQESLECYRSALGLCHVQITSSDPGRRALALGVLVEHMSFLLSTGVLDELTEVITPGGLAEVELRSLVAAVDEFLKFAERSGQERANEQVVGYVQKVHRWVDSLRPSDFDGKLRSVCAKDPWIDQFNENPRSQIDEVDDLAEQIRVNPLRLAPHLDWLASAEARSAERLGFSLGKVDKPFACAEAIFNQAIRWRTASLLRGYIRGSVFAGHLPTQDLLRLVSQLETAYPEMAIDVLVCAGDSFDALNRAIRLVELRAASPRFLVSFARGVGPRELRVKEVSRLLPYFLDAAITTAADVIRAGIRFLFGYLMLEKGHSRTNSCLERDDIRRNAWRLVEEGVPYVETRLSYEWSQIVEQLAGHDPNRAANLSGLALLSENLGVASQAQKQLLKLASLDPDAVMQSLGRALLDPSNGWRLQIQVLRDLVTHLSCQSVMNWVREHGIRGARAIARHLPRPYLDESGRPLVPEVLNSILREYDDDQVLGNFAAGAHSHEFWYGDGSEQFRRDADIAKQFLRHSNYRIREWAKHEIASRSRMAELEEREHAERVLP